MKDTISIELTLEDLLTLRYWAGDKLEQYRKGPESRDMVEGATRLRDLLQAKINSDFDDHIMS